MIPLLIKQRTVTLALGGSTRWLLLGTAKLPASLLKHLGAITNKIRGAETGAPGNLGRPPQHLSSSSVIRAQVPAGADAE